VNLRKNKSIKINKTKEGKANKKAETSKSRAKSK
jgi:hypothetical protein